MLSVALFERLVAVRCRHRAICLASVAAQGDTSGVLIDALNPDAPADDSVDDLRLRLRPFLQAFNALLEQRKG